MIQEVIPSWERSAVVGALADKGHWSGVRNKFKISFRRSADKPLVYWTVGQGAHSVSDSVPTCSEAIDQVNEQAEKWVERFTTKHVKPSEGGLFL